MTITRHLANKRNWNLWSLLFDVDDKCNSPLQNLPKIPSKLVPQHPLVSAQSASCKHFSAIYLTRNYLGTISDVYWIHVYLILILFPPRVLLDILTSLLASYLTPIFVRKSASLITVKHKGPYSELLNILLYRLYLADANSTWIIAISDDCFELYVLFYLHFYNIDTRTLFF